MLDFETFRNALFTIKQNVIRDRQLQNLVGDGVGTYTVDSNDCIVELLEHHFNGDKDKWIEWWAWECDFGTKDCYYIEKDSKERYDISDPRDFYNFIVEIYEMT